MENVKIGDTIKIIKMDGEPQYTNRKGVITHIDDAGQIHGTWGGCALIPEIDTFVILNRDSQIFDLSIFIKNNTCKRKR